MKITIESAATLESSRLSRIEFRTLRSGFDEAEPVTNNTDEHPYITVNQILEAEAAKFNFAHRYANRNVSEVGKAPWLASYLLGQQCWGSADERHHSRVNKNRVSTSQMRMQ